MNRRLQIMRALRRSWRADVVGIITKRAVADAVIDSYED